MKAGNRRVQGEKYWKDVIEVLTDNMIVTMQVLHENFGFGEKRLALLLDLVHKKAKAFDEAAEDGVLDIRTQWEREQFHDQIHTLIMLKAKEFLPDEMMSIFCDIPTCGTVYAERNAADKRKRAASMKDAAESAERMQELMLAAQNYTADICSGGTANDKTCI